MAPLARAVRFAFAASAWRAATVLALAVVAGLLPVGVAWFIKQLVDGVSGGEESALAFIVTGLLVSMLLIQLVPTVSSVIEADLGRSVETHARRATFEKVNAFGGLRYFESPRFHDELRLAVSAGEQVPTQLLLSATSLLQGMVTLVGFVVALVTIDWRAAVLVLVAAVPRLIIERRLGRDRFTLQADLSPAERLQMFYGMLQTHPGAAKEIRLFGAGGYFLNRMLGQLKVAQVATRRVELKAARAQVLLDLLAMLPLALCIFFAARAALNGSLGPGDVVLFLTALTSTESSMASMASMAARLHELSLTVGHFESLLRRPADIQRSVGRDAPPLESLEIDGVWFRYREDLPWVLKGLSLSIRAGDSVAIVGVNGAGKSTLIKLLCRFYDPERGRILWNGTDIREYDVDSLRDRLGTVFQDYMTYDLTVRENIALGDLSKLHDDPALLAVARSVGMAETILGLPRGLDTQLSRMLPASPPPADADAAPGPQFDGPPFAGPPLEGLPPGVTIVSTSGPGDASFVDKAPADEGTFLSGGQWQRLAVARMLLRTDSDLMILDEPTSGLDAEAEFEVNSLVQDVTQDRTRILVSHRLNAVRMASRIVVIENGVVAEHGAHGELIAREGRYSTLFELQRSGYVD